MASRVGGGGGGGVGAKTDSSPSRACVRGRLHAHAHAKCLQMVCATRTSSRGCGRLLRLLRRVLLRCYCGVSSSSAGCHPTHNLPAERKKYSSLLLAPRHLGCVGVGGGGELDVRRRCMWSSGVYLESSWCEMRWTGQRAKRYMSRARRIKEQKWHTYKCSCSQNSWNSFRIGCSRRPTMWPDFSRPVGVLFLFL